MKIKLITSILCFSLFLVSCRKADNVNSNSLNISLSGEISTLDPANSYDTISASVVYQCYEQLYEYHYLKRPYSLKPLLADGMPKIEENGKRYIFKIKKGIRYHDDPVFNGQPRFVKAQDFVTQIKRLAFIPTKSNGWWLFDGKIKGLNSFRTLAGKDFQKFQELRVGGLRTPDDYTLVIELTNPYPQMLYALAMSFTSPMPMEVVVQYNNLLNDRIVGTGPYKLDKWSGLAGIRLKKYEYFHEEFYPRQGDRLANSRGLLKDAGKKLPFIDTINFQIIKEAQTRWLNFRSKKIDLLIIPKDNYSSAIDPNGNLSEELAKDK